MYTENIKENILFMERKQCFCRWSCANYHIPTGYRDKPSLHNNSVFSWCSNFRQLLCFSSVTTAESLQCRNCRLSRGGLCPLSNKVQTSKHNRVLILRKVCLTMNRRIKHLPNLPNLLHKSGGGSMCTSVRKERPRRGRAIKQQFTTGENCPILPL